ncbi:SMP-30/gluconolactonase/LRE family protein [uncultured Vibrio sp.]|uniref:SMP-30/gluconolactonase/LRE family protein n=1 Tax=uncultured Vibrio sp. TaxID=114054 RepID=UPI00261000B0|nr:SMP-30/gluconolactonase/LRE family protein [uncultured Vibrio sp.]
MKLLLPTFLASLAMSVQAEVNQINNSPDVVVDSFKFTEGPLWLAESQKFIFSDIPNNTLWQLSEDGTISKFIDDSGYTNGNAIDKNGNIWNARHDRKLSRITKEGKVDIVAAFFNGKPLNSPNDVAIASDGSVWFTDPPFGINGSGPKLAKEEQPVRGIYRWQNGELELMNGDLPLPNGIGFNSGNLFVANTADGWVYKFSMTDTGLGQPEKFAKSGEMADGFAFDENHNLWLATTGGVAVFDPQGEQTGFLPIDAKHTSNVAISPKYVLVTASNKVLRFRRK